MIQAAILLYRIETSSVIQTEPYSRVLGLSILAILAVTALVLPGPARRVYEALLLLGDLAGHRVPRVLDKMTLTDQMLN